MTPACSVCGLICKVSKSDAVDAGWNFMDIKAPIVASLTLCPEHSKNHVDLFVDKMREAVSMLKTNPKKVSIKMQFPDQRPKS